MTGSSGTKPRFQTYQQRLLFPRVLEAKASPWMSILAGLHRDTTRESEDVNRRDDEEKRKSRMWPGVEIPRSGFTEGLFTPASRLVHIVGGSYIDYRLFVEYFMPSKVVFYVVQGSFVVFIHRSLGNGGGERMYPNGTEAM